MGYKDAGLSHQHGILRQTDLSFGYFYSRGLMETRGFQNSAHWDRTQQMLNPTTELNLLEKEISENQVPEDNAHKTKAAGRRVTALLNQRHEKFAQALAEGKSAIEAYKNAGYAPNDGNAARLKGNERIRARVAELQECAAAHAAVTLQGLIDEAADIQTKAMADGKYSAAVAALTVKAKLAGLWVDKAENNANNVVYHIADHPLTMDEWSEKWCSPGENISN